MSIKIKVTLMLSVLGLISVGSGIYLFQALAVAKNDASIIEVLGRQRMLTQAMAKSVLSNTAAKEVLENTNKRIVFLNNYITQMRGVYTKTIIGTARQAKLGISMTPDKEEHPSVPFPATFTRLVNTSAGKGSKLSVDILADNPINPDKKLLSAMDKEANAFLKANSKSLFFRPEEKDGKKYLTFYTADTAVAKGCADCHTKMEGITYKVGDLLGIRKYSLLFSDNVVVANKILNPNLKEFETAKAIFSETLSAVKSGGKYPIDLARKNYAELPAIADTKSQEIIGKIEAKYSEMQNMVQQVLGATESTARFDYQIQTVSLSNQLRKFSNDLVVQYTNVANATQDNIRIAIIASSLLILLAIVGVFVFTSKGVLGRMMRLSEGMGILAEGDNSVEIAYVDSTDELGEMAKAVQVFKDNAIERVRLEEESEKQRQAADAEKERNLELERQREKEDGERKAQEAEAEAESQRQEVERERQEAEAEEQRAKAAREAEVRQKEAAELERKQALEELADDFENQVMGVVEDVSHSAKEMVDHKIAHLAKKYGGNSIGLYGSGQLTMEGQYLENMFMKGVLGSNTIEANARMCMTSAVTGYFATLGSDTPPLAYEDIELSDMIMHFGHNAREAHPIIYWRAADHKRKKDIPTVVVDPRRTGTVMGYEDINAKNSIHVPILNGDISFLNAIAHVLLKDHEDVIDWDFVKAHANNWEEYVDGVRKNYSPEQVQDRMGGKNHDVSPAMIRRIAGLFADATRKRLARSKGTQKGGYGGVIIMWGIGYNQHIHGQHNVISIINLLTLTGNLAKPGCGPFSMTGQPNAMGERFTGGLTGRLPFNQPLKNASHRKHMAKHWRVPEKNLINAMNSKNPGYAVGMMERALKGDVKAYFFVYATHIDLPDQYNLVRPAITKTFNVVQEIYRHAPNNLYADVIFPAATWGEVEGVYISSERRLNICQKAAEPPKGCRPDMDMVIDKAKGIGKLLGLDMDKSLPYQRKKDGFYDAQEIFRDVIKASAGTDTDLTGILEVEKLDKITPYEQLAELRGIQWPAPTYEIAQNGGTKRRFMLQEGDWENKPYGYFRTKNGKVNMKLVHQDYSDRERLTKEMMRYGPEKDLYTIDNLKLIKEVRDKGLTPDMPDEEHRGKKWQDVPKDKYPYWFGLGVVYEHFHTAKSNRSPTTRRLVPEMYVEMHEDDAKDLGIKDGDKVRMVTRRGSLEARAQVGTNSLVKPSRNSVPRGYMFGPWNLSVADSADPKKNKWLANGVTSRIWDPVSGQVDFKKSAARIEKI